MPDQKLENILIMADIGVNTVMSFMERLRKRVLTENITDVSYLKEVIVDELFIIYVNGNIISNKINYNKSYFKNCIHHYNIPLSIYDILDY